MVEDNAKPASPDHFLLHLAADEDDSFFVRVSLADETEHGADGELDSGPGNKKSTIERKEDVSSAFRALSMSVTGSAIGFFELVPEFARLNFAKVEKNQKSRLVDILKRICVRYEEVEDSEGRQILEFELHRDELPFIAIRLGKTTQQFLAARSMAQAALGALISDYEMHLREILRLCALLRPDAFISGNSTITLDEVRRFESVEALQDALIEQKIDEVMSNSHEAQLRWIEERFGVKLTSAPQLINEFLEVCQRRHIIIHNGGRVNRRYIDKCRELGIADPELPELGKIAEVPRKYLRRATARVFQVCYFTLHILWQKIIPADQERSHSRILADSHDFLENNLTKMARRVCSFALDSKRPPTGKLEAYLYINLAQSYLFDVDLTPEEQATSVESVLARRDWSERSPTVSLAIACLRREFCDLDALISAAKADGLSHSDAHTFNIFREVRAKPEFIDHFMR